MLAKEINENSSRVGQVVLDRYKIIPIREVEQQLSVMLYIDMNAVKAGLAEHPKYYNWSSYNYYAFGTHDPLLTPSPYYLALSGMKEKRMLIYRELIEYKLIELKRWNVAKKQSNQENSNDNLITLL